MVGTLIAGPAGGAVGALVASALGVANEPSAVNEALKTNPEAAVKLAQIESDERVKLQGMLVDQAGREIDASVRAAADVNKSIQTEAASEHWPTYGWRPAIGFAVAIAVFLSVLTVFGAYGALIFTGNTQGLENLPGILAAVAGIIAVVSPILGIASWFRGKMQADPVIETTNKG